MLSDGGMGVLLTDGESITRGVPNSALDKRSEIPVMTGI